MSNLRTNIFTEGWALAEEKSTLQFLLHVTGLSILHGKPDGEKINNKQEPKIAGEIYSSRINLKCRRVVLASS